MSEKSDELIAVFWCASLVDTLSGTKKASYEDRSALSEYIEGLETRTEKAEAELDKLRKKLSNDITDTVAGFRIVFSEFIPEDTIIFPEKLMIKIKPPEGENESEKQ